MIGWSVGYGYLHGVLSNGRVMGPYVILILKVIVGMVIMRVCTVGDVMVLEDPCSKACLVWER